MSPNPRTRKGYREIWNISAKEKQNKTNDHNKFALSVPAAIKDSVFLPL